MKTGLIRKTILLAVTAITLQQTEAQQRTTNTDRVIQEGRARTDASRQKIASQMAVINGRVVYGDNYPAIAPLAPMAPLAPLAPIAPIGSRIYSADGVAWIDGNQKYINDQDLKSKEISQEISVSKTADVIIDNSNRGIIVKTWDQPKVKVTTTLYYEGDATKISDAEWFEKLNLSLKTLGSTVRVKSGSVSGGGSYSAVGQSYSWSSSSSNGRDVAVFSGDGKNIGNKAGKREIIVYVPKSVKLEIDSKYADVKVEADAENARIDITNGNLEMQNASDVRIVSKYSNVTMGNAKTAEIEIINGRLTAGTIDELDLDSKYCTIEIANAKKMIIRSTNDEYELDEVGEFKGRKNYGNLRINKLNQSLEIDGTNADVKIRNIAAGVNTIKIDNKYADIRLPLRNSKNYTINFSGAYASVYGNFEKKPLKVEGTADAEFFKETKDGSVRYSTRSWSNTNSKEDDCDCDYRFTAVIGDGKATKLNLKCQNCTVDFK
jgi:hypothetical protein